jgi:hypothetical protein
MNTTTINFKKRIHCHQSSCNFVGHWWKVLETFWLKSKAFDFSEKINDKCVKLQEVFLYQICNKKSLYDHYRTLKKMEIF